MATATGATGAGAGSFGDRRGRRLGGDHRRRRLAANVTAISPPAPATRCSTRLGRPVEGEHHVEGAAGVEQYQRRGAERRDRPSSTSATAAPGSVDVKVTTVPGRRGGQDLGGDHRRRDGIVAREEVSTASAVAWLAGGGSGGAVSAAASAGVEIAAAWCTASSR
ncbi:MAG: hypothetical protein R2939_18635 [Kofleriaceae bacterium]